jgi:flagellar protein FlbD
VIRLTRLNNQQFAVNSDLIKFIENAPDTVLTLTNAEKIVVLETTEQVVEKIIAFRRAVLAEIPSVSIDPNAAVANLRSMSTEQHVRRTSEDSSRG